MFPRHPVRNVEIATRFTQPGPLPEAVLEGGKIEVYDGRRFRWQDIGAKPPAQRVSQELRRRSKYD